MFFGSLRAPGRADADAAMRARADPDIFAVAPINQIVPALRAGPRVVGDLVRRQAMRLGYFLRRVEQRAGEVLAGHDELARAKQPLEYRVRLDGQLVERDMFARN